MDEQYFDEWLADKKRQCKHAINEYIFLRIIAEVLFQISADIHKLTQQK